MSDYKEWIFYGGLFLANLMLTHQWAKYGFLELGLARPMNSTVVKGFILGAVTMLFGGVVHKIMPEFNPQPTMEKILIVMGLPFAWMFFFRYAIMPKGLYDYNRARARLEFWMNQYFVPGTLLKQPGDNLREFGRAQHTVTLFQKAIEKQAQGISRRMFEREIELDEERRSYRYEYLFNCPVCGSQIAYPDRENQVLTAVCNLCGSAIHARKTGTKLYMTIQSSNAVREVPDRNKLNVAVAHEELALLYRMMNMFDEAKEALGKSISGIDLLLAKEPEQREYLVTKSLAIFRLAEVSHVTGDLAKAQALYRESMEIDSKLGDRSGMNMAREMLSAIS